MTTVGRWTGREAKLLREALRLSVRDFAAHLGVGVRTVNKWDARLADITPSAAHARSAGHRPRASL
jgi:DNA-binding transcriptional regulator YiaG